MYRRLFLYNAYILNKGFIIIANTQTIAEQFNAFHTNFKPKNLESALELFAIFGGVEWGNIEIDKEPYELIEKLILNDYSYIRNDISDLTTGMPLYHTILTGIAMGDGRTHSAFKRAGVESEVGMKAIDELCELGVIKKELSKKEFTTWSEDYKSSDKLIFTTPFLQFWFTFISPLFKGIRDGDYKEVQDRYQNRKVDITTLVFKQLSQELVKNSFKNDPLTISGSFWKKDIAIDIYAKTKSGKIIVGDCSYSNSKMKKNALTKLQEKSKHAEIKPDIFVLISKNGFSNELKSLKSENLKLYTLKNFRNLIYETNS